MTPQSRLPIRIACTIAIATFILSVVLLWRFTAEDAYITYRYGLNISQGLGPIFNVGERINAMTSPLHALVSAALHWTPFEISTANKLMGLSALLGSLYILWNLAGNDQRGRLLMPIAAGVPTAVILWSLGGLETPILLFLVALGLSLFVGGKSLLALCLVAALAFLCRHDSALFFAPLVAWRALEMRRPSAAAPGIALGLLIALAWLGFATFYFGDPFPTSFYVKAPAISAPFHNGAYILMHLGAAGLLLFGVVALLRPAALMALFKDRRYAVTVAALALMLFYGLSVATHHMMFGFRFFVPYIPVAAWLAVRAYLSAPPTFDAWMILAVCALNVAHLSMTTLRSMDGLVVSRSEYPAVGVREYAVFMQTLERNGADIRADAQRRGIARPVVHTFAGGIMPYRLRDAMILEQLVSFRKDDPGIHAMTPAAEYIHTVSPRHGSLARQTCFLPGLSRVSRVVIPFDGRDEAFEVFYNPNPLPLQSAEAVRAGQRCKRR